MKPISRTVALVALLLMTIAVQAQRRNAHYNEYIRQYAPLAVEQMRKYKIPASITLAQGLLRVVPERVRWPVIVIITLA